MRIRTTSRVLTFPETLELTIGPKPGRPAFASEADARAAWDAHRDDLIAASALGRRPWAYWAYDVGQPELDDDERPTAEAERYGWLLDQPEHLRLGEERAIHLYVERDLDWYEEPPDGRGWPPPGEEELAAERALVAALRDLRARWAPRDAS